MNALVLLFPSLLINLQERYRFIHIGYVGGSSYGQALLTFEGRGHFDAFLEELFTLASTLGRSHIIAVIRHPRDSNLELADHRGGHDPLVELFLGE